MKKGGCYTEMMWNHNFQVPEETLFKIEIFDICDYVNNKK